MPMPNPKNAGISPAAQALGLGDQLAAQVENEANLRKKKMREFQKEGSMGITSPAVNSLLGTGINGQNGMV